MVFWSHMQITKRHWLAAGLGFSIAVLAAFGWFDFAKAPTSAPAPAESNSASSTESGAPQAVAPAASVKPFALNAADAIASWSFKGAYTGNDTLIQQADADSAHLTALLGKGQYDDYDLHIGIGNDANLLGDGATAYAEYQKAVAIHPGKGLAFVNIGHLMDELGAYHSAADAYAHAVAVEPAVLEYHLERLDFLVTRFPTDNARIAAALTDAHNQFGDVAQELSIEAQWLAGQKRYADAVALWQRVKLISPGRDMTAIDAEIARLEAKQ